MGATARFLTACPFIITPPQLRFQSHRGRIRLRTSLRGSRRNPLQPFWPWQSAAFPPRRAGSSHGMEVCFCWREESFSRRAGVPRTRRDLRARAKVCACRAKARACRAAISPARLPPARVRMKLPFAGCARPFIPRRGASIARPGGNIHRTRRTTTRPSGNIFAKAAKAQRTETLPLRKDYPAFPHIPFLPFFCLIARPAALPLNSPVHRLPGRQAEEGTRDKNVSRPSFRVLHPKSVRPAACTRGRGPLVWSVRIQSWRTFIFLWRRAAHG